MTTAAKKLDSQSEEARILAKVDVWAKAAFSKDIDTVMTLYADDVRAFDVPTPLQFKGKDVYRAHWVKCCEMCPADGTSAAQDMNVVVNGDLGVSMGLIRFTFPGENGEKIESVIRLTQVWCKATGDWLIRHEHCSSPIDMETQKAVFNAQ